MGVLAVHLSDGVLPGAWSVAGFAAAAVLVAVGLSGLTERDVPRVAFATAAFFVASTIHVRLYGTSAHLLLNGFVGVVSGRRAGLAISVGLLFQTLLIEHGGRTALGVNVCVMTLPAFLAALAFHAARRFTKRGIYWPGFALGAGTVVVTVGLNAAVLAAAVSERVAAVVFLAHLPIALVEGCVVGAAVRYIDAAAPQTLAASDGE
jgi:cobalt/nickel transport system permease protein